ncbi:MAG: type II secretion system protein GspG [Gemmatimonadota bacterium]|nr:type II secretion system protein GspG [Gemmatimonadota bacterium]MDH5759235.1 type II secretion system protein GspG [Gemmatimonadota bacterium]
MGNIIKQLLKILVVVGAVVVAVPKTRARLLDELRPHWNQVLVRTVPSKLKAMGDQLDVRIGRGEGLPQAWEPWLRRDFTGVPEDPWGNIWYIDVTRSSYTVGSMGPDGVKGTEDDIRESRRANLTRR